MLRRFRLEEPESVAEVSELLGRFGDSAKIYAGGTELLLAMKEGLGSLRAADQRQKAQGPRAKSPAITARSRSAPYARIISWKPHRCCKQNLPSLVKLEQNVANVRVRQAGTIGGNLCFAEPHADPGTLLMALGAKMVAEKSSGKARDRRGGFFCRRL